MRSCNAGGWLAFAFAMLLAGVAPLRAEDAWTALTEQERAVLSPFAAEWATLDGPMRARLRVLADRWSGMPDSRRAAEMQKFRRWQALPPAQRELLRDRHRAFQQLDQAERARVRDEYRHWRQMSPRERRAMRGATGSMPAPWRAAVDGMDPASRQRLRAVIAELPPDARFTLQRHLRAAGPEAAGDALRGLLEQPAAARVDYIARLPDRVEAPR